MVDEITDAQELKSEIGQMNCVFVNEYIDLELLRVLWEHYEPALYEQLEK